MRPARFQDIDIGVKIIPVETYASLTPSTDLLLRDCMRYINVADNSPNANSPNICTIAPAGRGLELARWCQTRPITQLRANCLVDDPGAVPPNIDVLIMYFGAQLGKEVGFRVVKQMMAQYNYTDPAMAHIKALIDSNAAPKRVILTTSLAFIVCQDDQYVKLRKAFLNRYTIVRMSVCNDCVDNNHTLITIVADNNMSSTGSEFECVVYPGAVAIRVNLDNPLATIAYEYHEFVNYKSRYVSFSRYVSGCDTDATHLPTNLYLNSVDCATLPISMEIRTPVLGKSTDRMGCTITSNVRILPHVDKLLCDKFNEFINSMRDKYCSLFLVNFRGLAADSLGSRKRIPYSAAYAILGRFFDEIMDKGITGNLPRILQERNRRDPQFERLMNEYRKNNPVLNIYK